MASIDSAKSQKEYELYTADYYVDCGITGQRIRLSELKYWNVERQIAYIGPEVVPHEHFYPT